MDPFASVRQLCGQRVRLQEGDDGPTLDGEITGIVLEVFHGVAGDVKVTIESLDEGEWEFMADSSLTMLVGFVLDSGPFAYGGEVITIEWLDRPRPIAQTESPSQPAAAPGPRSRQSQLAE
jgi:hypothetical protein